MFLLKKPQQIITFLISVMLFGADIPSVVPVTISEKVPESCKAINRLQDEKSYSPPGIQLIPGFPDTPFPLYSLQEKPMANSGHGSLSSASVVFDERAAAHLLRRTLFGPRWDEIQQAVDDGLDATVSLLLYPLPFPAPPGTWIDHPFPENFEDFTPEQVDSLLDTYEMRFQEMDSWWLELMASDMTNMRESLVLFWHDHFATSRDKIFFPPAMYQQNNLIRQYAMGNIRDFVKAMAMDPAMLIWLDNNQNRYGAINENFARELLELFTIGIGNYTQDDIVAAARAYTGYLTDGLETYFIPSMHDYGEKTFMGQTGNWFGDDIVDIIFQQDETARFFARKIYRWFVYQYPDEAIVDELAVILRDNDYEMIPLLQALLSSEHFYDSHFRGAKIKSPIDLTVSALRQCYIDTEAITPIEGYPPYFLLSYFQFILGQAPFLPPNVSGWDGYRTWINTYTLPWRKTFTNGLFDGVIFDFNIGMQVDIFPFIIHFPDPNNSELLVDDLILYFFDIEPTDQVRQRILQELLQGAEPDDWSLYLPESEDRLRQTIKLIMKLPEFQLK